MLDVILKHHFSFRLRCVPTLYKALGNRKILTSPGSLDLKCPTQIQFLSMLGYDGTGNKWDGLDYNQKGIFLDIACCFLGYEKDYVTKILDESGFFATKEISVLLERCLVTVEWGKLKMHDLIREMGKTINSEKSPTQPGRWSRLGDSEAVTDVLTNKSGTEEIEALSLDLPSSKKKASFRTKAFVNMKKLIGRLSI